MFVGLRIGVEPAVSGIGIQSGDDQAVLQPLGVIVGPGASVTGHTVARRAGVGLRRIDRRHDHDAGIARPGILVHAIGNHIKAGPRDIVVSLPMRGRKLVGRAAVRLHLVRNGRTHQTARLVAAFRGRKIGKPAAGSRRLTPCRSAGRDRKRIGTAVGRDPSRNLTFDLEIIMRLRNGDLADDFRILRMHEHDLSLPDSRRIVVFERIFRTRVTLPPEPPAGVRVIQSGFDCTFQPPPFSVVTWICCEPPFGTNDSDAGETDSDWTPVV